MINQNYVIDVSPIDSVPGSMHVSVIDSQTSTELKRAEEIQRKKEREMARAITEARAVFMAFCYI